MHILFGVLKKENRDFKREKRMSACALSKTWSVGRCSFLPVWLSNCKSTTLSFQPFCFLVEAISCPDSIYNCMETMQPNYGNWDLGACVAIWLGYILHKGFICIVPYSQNQKFSFTSTLFTDCNIYMALNWVPPPPGTLKVNVHAASFAHPMPNGNSTGIGVVLRTSDANMMNCIAGTIPGLAPLGAQLWSVQIGLRRAFVERAQSVIIETDNMQAFGAIQFSHLHQHPEYDDLIHQILTRIRDPNWKCSFRFVYSVKNSSATYASLLGGELFCRLYLFYEPIGRLGELMDLDIGLGPQAPQFLEAPMVERNERYLKK